MKHIFVEELSVAVRAEGSITVANNASQLANDYKEGIVCCRKLIKHRMGACATIDNKAAITTPDLNAALGASAAMHYVGSLPDGNGI